MKISVALCTYNGERFLNAQIDSILDQHLAVDEIIICDDGSADGTLDILNSYQQKYPDLFRIHSNPNNLKSVKNFEKAIALCSNDIIFLSDQDDIWEKNKTETCISYFHAHPSIMVICSNGYLIDEKGTVQEQYYTLWDIPALLDNKNIDYYHMLATVGNIATGASMAVRKSFVREIIPFPQIENLHHDEWIAIAAAEQQNFAFLSEKLFRYRLHADQQVGGVCFPKNASEREKLHHKFDPDYPVRSFRDLKVTIRTLNDKQKRLEDFLKTQNNQIVKRWLKLIESEKAVFFKKMEKEHPLYSLFFKYVYR
ncbi:glycosyltransferase family 2 protein [Chryseobacterium camelliae]|uniref:glycosyltransferase family 2 protein n=1 Tax=Chryseobacterium camelliae TaxID=1265445 RepID=UPI000C1C8F0B|nr:glycosyltransferase family 2 protein [Chryseobacterium camelliae]